MVRGLPWGRAPCAVPIASLSSEEEREVGERWQEKKGNGIRMMWVAIDQIRGRENRMANIELSVCARNRHWNAG